jgi:hypothetical protein
VILLNSTSVKVWHLLPFDHIPINNWSKIRHLGCDTRSPLCKEAQYQSRVINERSIPCCAELKRYPLRKKIYQLDSLIANYISLLCQTLNGRNILIWKGSLGCFLQFIFLIIVFQNDNDKSVEFIKRIHYDFPR